jgi:hypothetical protein
LVIDYQSLFGYSFNSILKQVFSVGINQKTWFVFKRELEILFYQIKKLAHDHKNMEKKEEIEEKKILFGNKFVNDAYDLLNKQLLYYQSHCFINVPCHLNNIEAFGSKRFEPKIIPYGQNKEEFTLDCGKFHGKFICLTLINISYS